MILYYLVLILMTIIGAVAGYCLKKSSSVGLLNIIKNYYFYLGAGLYFISALLNIYTLKFLDFSIVLPLTSITYIWTMIISSYKLNEKISRKKILGISAILIGAIFIVL
jgi:drug/metabolite transporter (DMT)-like permease